MPITGITVTQPAGFIGPLGSIGFNKNHHEGIALVCRD